MATILIPNTRGQGTTSQQMKDAPKGATFIWCNGNTHYPAELAHLLKRKDLRIRPISILNNVHNLAGLSGDMVVLDHAAPLLMTQQQEQNWRTWQVMKRVL